MKGSWREERGGGGGGRGEGGRESSELSDYVVDRQRERGRWAGPRFQLGRNAVRRRTAP